MTGGERIAVDNSSNVDSFSYSPAKGVLTVWFKSGAVWEYGQVPQSVFEEMKQADSKGKFVRNRIVGYFEGRKVIQ